mgnify:FL=1
MSFLEDQETAETGGKHEEIVLKWRRVEVLQGQGIFIYDAVRHVSGTPQTCSR